MDLIHNATFELLADVHGMPAGLYRVVLDEPAENITVVVLFKPKNPTIKPVGRRRKPVTSTTKRKKEADALVGQLMLIDRDALQDLNHMHDIVPKEIDRAPIYYQPIEGEKPQKLYAARCKAMSSFLDYEALRDSILMHRGLAGLVKQAVLETKCSRNFVYQQWSRLCRFGFSQASLRTRWDLCGAPGKKRDNSGTNPRKKSGRKTAAQRISHQLYGVWGNPIQPGMDEEWRELIKDADRQIPFPKPSMRERYKRIIASHFTKGLRYDDNNNIVSVDLVQGEYPNYKQVKRVLTEDATKLQRIREKTTTGHFKRTLRGMVARNWEGVSGPGHTWAIDSTVGDIYLRSSVNPAWIVGRPIVYIMVDVWSTAIVGFYVCLMGPSWDMAKVSLFNAIANPALMGDLWGCEIPRSLFPLPTLPFALLCDRGEYLSKRARETGMQLVLNMQYAPPYRPDLKGIVEVLHRIQKNTQFLFIPGAMDARRAEYDLRRSNPAEATMTVRQYTHYLYQCFDTYNLTAVRDHRLDAHMKAAGVFPSPAGLWRWGHAVGAGYRKSSLEADIVTQLLPQDQGRVTPSGVRFRGNDYRSPIVEQQEWSTTARSFGGWNLPIHYYPGSVSKIWTPSVTGNGLIDLSISDQANASAELSYEEVADSAAFGLLSSADIEHERTRLRVLGLKKQEAIKEVSAEQTRIALERAHGSTPSMTEARHIENTQAASMGVSEFHGTRELRDEAQDACLEMMQGIFDQMNEKDNNV